jgi:hypothetical protein
MRRALGLLIATTALGVAPAVAGAAPEDFTSGSASYDECVNCGADLIWTGHGTPANARGQAHIRQPSVLVDSKATVDCVFVEGNRATVSGRLEKPSPATDGPFYEITIEDNGPGRTDRIDVGYIFFPIDCEAGNQFPATFAVSRGNGVVMDRTP